MITSAVLKSTFLGVGLVDTQLEELGKLGEVRVLTPGHVLEKIGDAPTEMYVVLNGELRVTTHDNDTLGEIKAGNIVGEIAVVDTHPRTANVVCCGHVTIGAFSVAALRKYIMTDKDAGIHILANIARVLAIRLRNADHKIDDLADKTDEPWNKSD